jgi:glycosyltransferase involved in cell wall biosynthesis
MANNSKRIVFITTRIFWPADSGRKVSLWHYCQGLHDRLGYDVYVYAFLEGDQKAAEADAHPDFIQGVRVAEPIAKGTKLENLRRALGDKGMPFQCALYLSKGNARAIRAYCEEVKPDAAVIDMVRLAPYASAIEDLGCAVLQDFDDLLSKRYRRQLGEGGSALGKYGEQASGLLNRLMGLGFVKNGVLKSEAARIGRAEDEWGARADAVLFVSPIEAAEMDERLGERKCFNATVGAEIPDVPAETPAISYDFGFVGNMFTAANQASLEYVVNDVLPLMPGSTLRVIGVCPDDVSTEYAGNAQVSFSGRVESIGDELLCCRIMLAPFAYGTGIKTKVLEAMGLGVPVVTNAIGLEGLSARPGVEVMQGETPQELRDACEVLLSDDGKQAAIAAAGREYVRANHNWDKSVDCLGECINFALSHAENVDVPMQHGAHFDGVMRQ